MPRRSEEGGEGAGPEARRHRNKAALNVCVSADTIAATSSSVKSPAGHDPLRAEMIGGGQQVGVPSIRRRLDRYAASNENFVPVAPDPHSGPRRAKRAKETLLTSRGLRWDIKGGARDWSEPLRSRERRFPERGQLVADGIRGEAIHGSRSNSRRRRRFSRRPQTAVLACSSGITCNRGGGGDGRTARIGQ